MIDGTSEIALVRPVPVPMSAGRIEHTLRLRGVLRRTQRVGTAPCMRLTPPPLDSRTALLLDLFRAGIPVYDEEEVRAYMDSKKERPRPVKTRGATAWKTAANGGYTVFVIGVFVVLACVVAGVLKLADVSGWVLTAGFIALILGLTVGMTGESKSRSASRFIRTYWQYLGVDECAFPAEVSDLIATIKADIPGVAFEVHELLRGDETLERVLFAQRIYASFPVAIWGVQPDGEDSLTPNANA